jgi:sugar/nucleoside kinase (ribokinase family)
MIATVLCFGNLQLDVLCRTVTALPPPGELHMIDAIDFALSGNGGNVAAALGRLGLEVELAGYSGAEIIGEQLRVTLAAMGVGTDKLLRHPTASTGISVITLSPSVASSSSTAPMLCLTSTLCQTPGYMEGVWSRLAASLHCRNLQAKRLGVSLSGPKRMVPLRC